MPIERPGPIDDRILLARGFAEHFLQHQVIVDRRHAPDRCLHGTPFDVPIGQLLRRAFAGLSERGGKGKGGENNDNEFQ
jgi:hypothetical protein